MSLDLVLVPGSNCCIFIIHLLFLIFGITAWVGGDTYCFDTYPEDSDGRFSIVAAGGCHDDKRCQILKDGQVFNPAGNTFSCSAGQDCICNGIGLSDPAFTTLIICALFFFVKLLIELYLIWCANYLCSQNFKQESKKILRLSESIWLRCVQCRAPASWQVVMEAYESGHFYAFKERVFYMATFVNFVFIIIAIVAYNDLNQSLPGFAIFYIIGAVITLILMCFSCFVKYKYISWAKEPDDNTEMGTR